MDWIGRFHPVLVHLPIGMLVLAALFQLFRGKQEDWQKTIRSVLFVGFIGAVLACIAGWILANEGGYHDRSLFIHRWGGIAIALVTFLLWRWHSSERSDKYRNWAHLAMLGGLTYIGHQGGSMTHGQSFTVEKAPKWMQKVSGYDGRPVHASYTDPDSVVIYRDLIEPFTKAKCATCHNEWTSKGGLDITSDSLFAKGGRNGDVLGASSESEFYRRVTMDPLSRKFMPPKGNGLSYQDIKLLGWWLDNGSDFDKTVSLAEHPKEIQEILMDRHGLDTKPKTFLEKTKVDLVPDETMAKLQNLGFGVNKLAQDNNFLDVRWRHVDTLNVNDAIASLKDVSSQVAWLDLSRAGVEDESLSALGELTNMVRLKLDNNPVTDAGVEKLQNLRNLESLNLYNTSVTDGSVESIGKLTSLKRVYLWLSQVTAEGKAQLEGLNEDLDVNLGITEEG